MLGNRHVGAPGDLWACVVRCWNGFRSANTVLRRPDEWDQNPTTLAKPSPTVQSEARETRADMNICSLCSRVASEIANGFSRGGGGYVEEEGLNRWPYMINRRRSVEPYRT